MAFEDKERLPIQTYPAPKAIAVTPHNSNDLTVPALALWIGTSGDVSVEMLDDGSAIVFKNVSGLLPVQVTRVNSTATTATDIVALWQ